jgi:hypothetical protein
MQGSGSVQILWIRILQAQKLMDPMDLGHWLKTKLFSDAILNFKLAHKIIKRKNGK